MPSVAVASRLLHWWKGSTEARVHHNVAMFARFANVAVSSREGDLLKDIETLSSLALVEERLRRQL